MATQQFVLIRYAYKWSSSQFQFAFLSQSPVLTLLLHFVYRQARFSTATSRFKILSMSPLPNPSDVRTPDVIATVVYRVTMVMVGLAFIWKSYRRPVRPIDGVPPPPHPCIGTFANFRPSDEHLVGILIPNHSSRTLSTTSIASPPEHTSRFRSMDDFTTAQLESIVQSTFGVEDATPPLVSATAGVHVSTGAGSSTSACSVDGASRRVAGTVEYLEGLRLERSNAQNKSGDEEETSER